ncbi:hypothetical protein DSECCO2_629970 [anaerobic digester metagenome]
MTGINVRNGHLERLMGQLAGNRIGFSEFNFDFFVDDIDNVWLAGFQLRKVAHESKLIIAYRKCFAVIGCRF